MLNSTTKNRINSCRDILVGKIPDPKGQVDQITNALVYKFMDDQDRMSRELGYEASFFTGDYESYAWSRLFDTKLTNQDRANLYIEGLDRLSRADHLPDLFKQIFKDAYLPFRDANTIVMFLTEINGFDYHHSEELGNAFEYLLSIMGSQGDAGQFRTPRHIIEFLVDVVDPQKSETILDPACGTAGFLVEAFKHITAKGDLGVQDVAKLAESITGVDIDPGMAKIARVNLYLHGFKTPKITENDTLTNEKLWGTKYDVILANPPFMTPKGGIQPHDKFAIRANRAEVLFTDYIAEHLRLHGRAGIIVPEGIIFQGSNAYKDLRKMLVDDGYLWAVVSLPSGVFNPYAGVKTSILFLDRERAKNNDSILFVKISADGYDLGAQRREISKNDLPKALEILNQYKENPNIELGEEQLAHLVEKSKIIDSEDYNLSGDKYIVGSSPVSTEYEMVELGKVCKFTQGIQIPKEEQIQQQQDGYKRYLYIQDFKGENKSIFVKDQYKNKEVTENDLVMANTGTPGRAFIAVPGILSNNLFRISYDRTILDQKYLFYILEGVLFQKILQSQMKGGIQKHLGHVTIAIQKIPLPPLEIQEQIVAEIDGYQRIIDGARAVVESYKPMIKIDSEWEMVELGNIATKVEYGIGESAQENGELRYVRITDIDDSYRLTDSEKKFLPLTDETKEYLLNKGDVLIARTGATFGKCLYFDSDEPAAFAGYLIRVIFDPKLNSKFFSYFAQSENYWNQAKSLVTGGGQPQFNASAIKQIKIPLPSLEIQQSIVERIEEEQRLVDANRRLIEIYEGKIREKMDEVWGITK